MLPRLAVLAGVLALTGACSTGSSPGATGGYGPASPVPSATSEDAAPSPSPTTSTTTPALPRPRLGARVRVAGSEFGAMLYAASGQAIYLFDKEDGTRPECYGACAAEWPPVLTDGEPRGLRGARQELLGTTERRDGSVQVTYGGHPLYFYAHEDPWQVLCHDFVEYGGTWFVVQPDGDAAPPAT